MSDDDVFSPERTAERRRKLFDELGDKTDVVILGLAGGGGDRLYFTGAHEGTAVADREGVRIITHVMLAEAAARSGLPVAEFRTAKQYRAAVERAVGGARTIALPRNELPAPRMSELRTLLPGKRWVDSSPAVREVAATKDPAELAILQQMTRIITKVMARVPGWLKEGVTEAEIKGKVECGILRAGAGRLTFGALVSFGGNTSLPHALSGTRKLRPGDFVMVDAGGARFGYGSDMTRTFVFGRARPRQKRIYRNVLDAMNMAYELFAQGKEIRQVNRAIDRAFRKANYGPFIHSVGHTLGPVPSPVTTRPGAVFTIEPGIYVRGYGGVRIEDDVVVTDDGLVNLTPYTRELVEVT